MTNSYGAGIMSPEIFIVSWPVIVIIASPLPLNRSYEEDNEILFPVSFIANSGLKNSVRSMLPDKLRLSCLLVSSLINNCLTLENKGKSIIFEINSQGDYRIKRLRGGSTHQILSKNKNTGWITYT